MAKIIGPIHSEFAQGSLGSTCFKRNQYGIYAVTKPAYVDNPTANKIAWRAIVHDVLTTWDTSPTITAGILSMWLDFSKTFSSGHKYGKELYASPRQWFLKLNCHKRANGYGYNYYPPVDAVPNYHPVLSFSQDSAGIWLEVDPWPTGVQLVYLAWVPYQSLVRRFCPHNQVRLAYVRADSNNPLLVVPNADLLAESKRYFFLYRSIDAWGRLSPWQIEYHDYANLWSPENPYIVSSDTYLDESSPASNYGLSDTLKLQSGSGDDQHSILWLDISSIPSGHTILSASLFLYCTYKYKTSFVNLYRLLHPWQELQSSWQNRATSTPWDGPGCLSGSDYESAYFVRVIVDAVSTWFEFNVTSTVIGWYNGSIANYGLFLDATTLNCWLEFASVQHASTSIRPYFFIEFAD